MEKKGNCGEVHAKAQRSANKDRKYGFLKVIAMRRAKRCEAFHTKTQRSVYRGTKVSEGCDGDNNEDSGLSDLKKFTLRRNGVHTKTQKFIIGRIRLSDES